MAWDEDFARWFRRGWSWPGFNFENIEKMFDDMFREAFEAMPKELYREKKLPDGSSVRHIGPFVYGYAMSMDPDGRPVIREFGNVKPSRRLTPSGVSKPSLDVREEREPLVDIMSDADLIRVIAEVPGVEKKDILLNCSEKMLTISVDSEKRKYYKDVDLPADVDPTSAKARYTNGVLEVTMTKAKKQKSERIKIE